MKLCLLFPREALSVPVARRLLGDALRGLGAEDQGVSDLLLAVTEACTNVIRHASASTRYEVVACVRQDDCEVEVVEGGTAAGPAEPRRPGWSLPVPPPRSQGQRGQGARGQSRSPRPWLRAGRQGPDQPSQPPAWSVSAPAESVPGLQEGGRGLAIMRACVDDVTLSSRPEQGTVVSLHKRMQWRSGGPYGCERGAELANTG